MIPEPWMLLKSQMRRTKMSEQELNKKLAEWAAIEVLHFNDDKHRHYRFGGEYDIWHEDEPDFLHSLDACFKWLVPKLKEMGLTITLYFGIESIFANIGYPDTDIRESIFLGEAGTPALALCKAIEKLIDELP